MKKIVLFFIFVFGMVSFLGADKLDKVISSGKLKCGVVLDFPPMGYFSKDNKPAGFDVDYCKDLAKVLNLKLKIVNLTWAERIPSLISGKTDLVIGSTSDTLQRAKTAGFTIPYYVFKFQVVHKKNTKIKTFEDLKDKKVGAGLSTTYEIEFLKHSKERGWDKNNYVSLKSENDVILALKQGKVDAIITTDTVASSLIKSGKYKNFVAGPFLPNFNDFVSIIVKRTEYGWLNYLNLFVNQQVRTGRYAELYKKHMGSSNVPKLSMDNVYY